jgi:hypothetical protein
MHAQVSSLLMNPSVVVQRICLTTVHYCVENVYSVGFIRLPRKLPSKSDPLTHSLTHSLPHTSATDQRQYLHSLIQSYTVRPLFEFIYTKLTVHLQYHPHFQLDPYIQHMNNSELKENHTTQA